MTNILDSFDNNKTTYDAFAGSIERLLRDLISDNKISIHTLETRVKERRSLELKIAKKDKYTSIDEITDIVGVRVITHYSSDVDKIAEIIEREFSVDKKNSIDKRASLEPDRFGYLSLHYVVSHSESRCDLSENLKYKKIKAEIQIRSILQHAWAEIEHDIGYKSNVGLPPDIRRRFSRLAGLLEIADNEFTQIQETINNYETKIGEDISTGKKDMDLDIVSITQYINKSKTIDTIIDSVIQLVNVTYSQSSTHDSLDETLKILGLLKIETISSLDSLLLDNAVNIAKRTHSIYNEHQNTYITTGIPRQYIIGHLCQILVAQENNREYEEYFSEIANLYLEGDEIVNYFEGIRSIL